jgi:hypothetical protein
VSGEPTALPAPLGKRNAGGRELLDAVVIRIRNVHVAVAIERHGGGVAKLPGSPTEASEDPQTPTCRRNYLDLIVAPVGDIEVSLSVDCQAR